MTLPKNTPTLEALATKNWTCSDNVFCTDHTAQLFNQCYTEPSWRGPKIDHVPILSILELDAPKVTAIQSKNFRDIDWAKFQSTLEAKLTTILIDHPIIAQDQFHDAAEKLTAAITNTIEKHVPLSQPCPHSKRWWN
ncbi:hypothetical protein BU15DRAFT_46082 [Melanogaster broomeanus]|nr:hypothetical protein BU15DRAFT_46082 [Melanogaster broomeanus]